MINQLKEKGLQVAAAIEGVNPEYQEQRTALINNQDLTAEARKRQAWGLHEKALNKAEELKSQGLGEVVEAKELLARQQTLAQNKADNEAPDLEKRAKVEGLKQQYEAELIAAGPFEFMKAIRGLLDGEAGALRLEAAQAVLPSLQAALSPDNSKLARVEIQGLARDISDRLKPEGVKKYEADLEAVNEIESEITGAYTRAARLLEKAKPAGPEPGSPWSPEGLKKAGEPAAVWSD